MFAVVWWVAGPRGSQPHRKLECLLEVKVGPYSEFHASLLTHVTQKETTYSILTKRKHLLLVVCVCLSVCVYDVTVIRQEVGPVCYASI